MRCVGKRTTQKWENEIKLLGKNSWKSWKNEYLNEKYVIKKLNEKHVEKWNIKPINLENNESKIKWGQKSK